MEKKEIMQGYLDIHTHVLPKVDDGSKDIGMSMDMIRMAYEQGVRVMVATPHYYTGHKNPSVERIHKAYEQVCEEIKKEYSDFTLLLGNEIYYREGTIQELKEGNVNCMAGTRYVLVEFSFSVEYKEVYSAVQELVRHGYVPIIAHIDRYPRLSGLEKEVGNLIEAGAYIQVNTEAFIGSFIQKRYRFVWNLLKAGYIHFLGSDCHDNEERVPLMDDVVKKFYKKIDKEQVDKLLYENQKCFLEGQYIKTQ